MKIAIFDQVGTYFSAPTLHCILEELDHFGVSVDLYLMYGGDHLQSFRNVRALPFPINIMAWKGNLISTLKNIRWFIKYKGWKGESAIRSSRYDITLGLNPAGVIAAYQYWKRTATPYIYLSFEMMFRDELHSKGDLREKMEEISASRSAAFVISQDEWRARLLCEENEIPIENFEYIPIAPRGGSNPVRGNFLRKKFNIPNNKVILLHTGTFGDFTCADQITQSVKYWPSNYVLVVNTYHNSNKANSSIKRLKNMRFENVYITEGALSVEDYAVMVQSADLGIAFYQPSKVSPFGGKNISNIGLSSGKLASYLRFGIPVLCTGNPILKTFLDQYPFGEYITDFRNITNSIERINENWTFYSNFAYKFFNNRLDFNLHWPRVWNRLKSIL